MTTETMQRLHVLHVKLGDLIYEAKTLESDIQAASTDTLAGKGLVLDTIGYVRRQLRDAYEDMRQYERFADAPVTGPSVVEPTVLGADPDGFDDNAPIAVDPETIDPTRLVAEGWMSTSNAYCHIARWKLPVPKVEDLIRPELINAPHVKRILAHMRHRPFETGDLRSHHDPFVERRVLPPELFKAFRAAGGQVA